jgi:hypothetical protein
MIDRYAVFSKHAMNRLKECQLSMAKANWLLYQGKEEKLTKDMKERKLVKYSKKALHIRYGTVLFTMIPTKDKRTNEPIYLVVSVFDQRIDL